MKEHNKLGSSARPTRRALAKHKKLLLTLMMMKMRNKNIKGGKQIMLQ